VGSTMAPVQARAQLWCQRSGWDAQLAEASILNAMLNAASARPDTESQLQKQAHICQVCTAPESLKQQLQRNSRIPILHHCWKQEKGNLPVSLDAPALSLEGRANPPIESTREKATTIGSSIIEH
jgi:hypothetical protein